MTNAPEAIGLVRAAAGYELPVVVAFTVETDGRLPTGQDLKDAIAAVDAATNNAPAYYMVNCAHPTHFEAVLTTDESWIMRLRGVRANASRRSHAELNEAPDLDDGDPVEFGAQFARLLRQHPQSMCSTCLRLGPDGPGSRAKNAGTSSNSRAIL
jgi:S-methylmethionine-dependent homocysteine/selenocysteine methylase